MAKSSGFIAGYDEAMRQMEAIAQADANAGGEGPLWYTNPYPEGTDEHRGFEEGFYDFTQK